MTTTMDNTPTAPAPHPPLYIEPTSSAGFDWVNHSNQCPRHSSPVPPTSPSPSSPSHSPSPTTTTTTTTNPCTCTSNLKTLNLILPPYSLPVSWLCGTCGATRSVLVILINQRVVEEWCCGSPALRAVYDQFGRIFLYWRDRDPAVSDLRDPGQVREAAERVWRAGGGELLGLGLGEGFGGGLEQFQLELGGGYHDHDDGHGGGTVMEGGVNLSGNLLGQVAPVRTIFGGVQVAGRGKGGVVEAVWKWSGRRQTRLSQSSVISEDSLDEELATTEQ